MKTFDVGRGTLLVWIGCLLLAGGFTRPVLAHPSSVSYTEERAAGLRLHVVTVNLNDPEVKVSAVLARGGVGRDESFGSFVSRAHPTAAVTGTFFSVRSLIPVGDIVIGGRMVHIGPVGTGLCFTADNRVVFLDRSEGRKSEWIGFDSVLCTGPRLVTEGVARVDPHSEGFRDSSLFTRRPRVAAGVTRWNRLLLVTVGRPVYLSELARAMRKLGAVNAVGLDGGSSSALYYKGSYITRPGRRLTNILAIYSEPWQFQYARDNGVFGSTLRAARVAPGGVRRSSSLPLDQIRLSRRAPARSDRWWTGAAGDRGGGPVAEPAESVQHALLPLSCIPGPARYRGVASRIPG